VSRIGTHVSFVGHVLRVIAMMANNVIIACVRVRFGRTIDR